MISTQEITTERYLAVRKHSEKLCEPLEIEDFVAQPVMDVSPPKWHLAHTTWFFENFLLVPHERNYKPFHPQYQFLFNSYYVQAGERWKRDERGYLTRPTVKEILEYRKYVDEHMAEFIEHSDSAKQLNEVIELGLQHEQQHQELLLYDLKYILGLNPLFPVYQPAKESKSFEPSTKWHHVLSGNYGIGYTGEGFHYDNEEGAHTVFLHDFEIANSVVTKGEFLAFMQDGGYENVPLWLEEGAKWVSENEIKSPMYWVRDDRGWMEYTLNGLQPIDFNDPVTHVSFYEADAFARWKGLRLPTEQEWDYRRGQAC